MRALYRGLPVGLMWAIDEVSMHYQLFGGDVSEVDALLERATAGDGCSLDAEEACESLTEILPGLEFIAW